MTFLPPNIDLTAHSDFGVRALNLHPVVSHAVAVELSELDDRGWGMEDYDKMATYYKIFGDPMVTERHRVFRKTDEEYRAEFSTHCQRCGVELRIPWETSGGLCKKCNEDLDILYPRIPWLSKMIFASDPTRIFDLK